ncbi:hypothetical protein BH23CHL5_BH23CHL5_24960 [soil metagenome]
MVDLVADVYRLFINRVDCYLGWHERWVLKRQPIAKDLVIRAMNGDIALGIQAVSKSGTTRWTCLDVDEVRMLPALFDAARTIPENCRLLELSRRGGHLWVFHQATDWETAHEQGMTVAQHANLGQIEVYPKHGGLHALRLPSTRHPKSGKVYPAVEPESGELLDLPSLLPGISATFTSFSSRTSSIRRERTQGLFDEPSLEIRAWIRIADHLGS